MYEDNYHEKFASLCQHKRFTGRAFNPVEFLHHLTNINFHFECGELSKLSDAALEKIKGKFSFVGYCASIIDISFDDENYSTLFMVMVKRYGDKYGYAEKTKNCKLCGKKMVWEHPYLPGHFLESSCNLEDWPICHECMVEHCVGTNCMGCGYGKYPDCRFLDMKRHYMNND